MSRIAVRDLTQNINQTIFSIESAIDSRAVRSRGVLMGAHQVDKAVYDLVSEVCPIIEENDLKLPCQQMILVMVKLAVVRAVRLQVSLVSPYL